MNDRVKKNNKESSSKICTLKTKVSDSNIRFCKIWKKGKRAITLSARDGVVYEKAYFYLWYENL